ncbi:MAG: 16S rRNA (cytosine(1402)-N(4))-methyltransferase RsmH [Candidatus Portnoybacteria bacterium]|jgi:16S rRNA (cytosine1402-N4)-methyltransferase|nr:16S rRNA (cytosine(1402)-N(4))-methyltransferase RsmH [Candidatus Portnoybacteria bacterium]
MHVPVLLKETVEILDPRPGKNFIDLTCGGGGHLAALLEQVAPNGKILAVDWDEEAIARAKKKIPVESQTRIIFKNANFADVADLVSAEKFGPVHGILLDLGWSSDQLETSGRGFSFLRDEPLDMRYNAKSDGLTAREIVNQWPPPEIEKILKDFGEERLAKKITAALIKARQQKPILTTGELVAAIAPAVPLRLKNARIHFATRTFQALRIAVNDELGNLAKVLPRSMAVLETGGRLAVISFHSLEDRLVKKFFRQTAGWKILNKRPLSPLLEEVKKNPRSRSAKLRAAEKI